MKMARNILSVVTATALLAATTGLVACGPKEEKTIKIGAVLPLTGDGAKYGEASKNGIDLAIKEINEKGGIRGKNVEIIYEDSKGEPKTGVTAIEKLITVNRVSAVIGGLFSSVTLAMAPIANENNVVLLSPASSSPKITEAGDYVFRNCASDIFEGEVMADYAASDIGIDNVAVLYINNDYGVGIKEVFKDTFIKKGGKVVSEEAFPQNATDFKTQLTKIKALNVDAIYIVGYKESGYILKQAKEVGIDTLFLSTVMIEDPEIIDIAGAAADEVIYTYRVYDPDATDETIRAFVDKYEKHYGDTPDIFAALSYDAANILALAIDKGGFTGPEIKQYLYTIKDYPGVVGNTTFNENGDVIKPMTFKVIRNGKFEWL